ncbi:uroporphyrinogen-III synthase [Deinococcus sp. Marseille-Q6407]|uniref:uroporphyrinogen-III synthase n=1 Tax=Deinococcus sp. Marseille-Q6407 TaxID=2969223 RepID=UPI0021BE241D|nr:uroporphyrinogen-III synthase [Deinococcus sp. Marseille-Q6407]
MVHYKGQLPDLAVSAGVIYPGAMQEPPPDHAPLDPMPPAAAAHGRIVVTLTGAGGQRLTRLARAAGWQAALWPGLTFVPTGRAEQLRNLGSYSWLALTSPQGARSLIQGLEELHLSPAALAGLRVAAVGEGTARPLARWGRSPDFVPGQADAHSLAAELPSRPGEQVLHVTGEGSRDRLQRGLADRGTIYRRLDLYRSQAVHYSAEARRDLTGADWVVVASGRAAAGLAEQLGTALPILAMGNQTAEAARAAGFARVRQAAEPSVEGLLAALGEPA